MKRSAALVVSLALNIFLAAFLLGRVSTGPGTHDWHGDGGPCHHGGPPPGESHGGGFGPHGHPPFIPPDALFTPQEMEADHPYMAQEFGKIHALRDDFTKKLATGQVTKAEVDNHFIAVEAVMDEIKTHIRHQAAQKIMAMTPEERKKLAATLATCDADEAKNSTGH